LKENLENIDNFIKNQLDSHEFPYDGNEWLKLDKKMSSPGQSQFFNPRNFFIASAVTIGIVATVLLVNTGNEDENRATQNKNITEQVKVSEQVNGQNVIQIKQPEKTDVANENHTTVTLEKQTLPDNNFKNEIVIEKQDNRKQGNDVNNSNQPPVNCNNKTEKGIPNQKFPCALFRTDVKEGCAPVTVKFTPFEKCDTAVYLWDFGDGSVSSDMTATHTFTDAGKYDISLTVKYFKSEKIVSKFAAEEISALKTPEVNFSYESEGGKISFTAMSDITNRFSWSFGDGNSSKEINPEHLYTNSGKYRVSLKAQAINGCENSYEEKITVDLIPAFEMPDAFTPNGDGRNDYFGPVVNDLELVKFEMEIYNKLGQIVYKTTSFDQPWDGRVLGSNKMCDAGVYVWRVKTTDKYGNSDNSQGSFTLVR